MTEDQKLAHSLKMKFGTAPGDPTDAQLSLIKRDILKINASGRVPTEADWLEAVSRYCPQTGHYSYHGIDNSDLNTLLSLAIQVAKK